MKNKELEEAAKAYVTQTEGKPEVNDLGTVDDVLARGGVAGPGYNKQPKTQMDLGYQNIPIEALPSKGMFYPEGTKILIRAARGAEIKHWSTLNEQDPVMLDGMLNYMIEKLVTVSIPGRHSSFKDLLDVDRLYLIFALNEYTFKNGENKITAEIQLDDGTLEKVNVTKDVIKVFEIPEKLLRFYDEDRRMFVFNVDGEEFTMKMPTIGVSKFIYEMREKSERAGKKLDQDFMLYALFMINDWRTITEEKYREMAIASAGWSVKRISLMSRFVDLMKDAINPQMTVMTSAGEVTRELNFQGGIKSLFIIPDILDELD